MVLMSVFFLKEMIGGVVVALRVSLNVKIDVNGVSFVEMQLNTYLSNSGS